MSRRVRRPVLATIGATATAVLLSTGPASAHFCYFTEANVNAERGRAGSQAFTTFGALAFEFTGLCNAGIEVLADAAGVSTGTTIHTRTVMAGGTLRTGKNIKPISHLDFDAIDAAFGDAIAACR